MAVWHSSLDEGVVVVLVQVAVMLVVIVLVVAVLGVGGSALAPCSLANWPPGRVGLAIWQPGKVAVWELATLSVWQSGSLALSSLQYTEGADSSSIEMRDIVPLLNRE